MGITFSQLKFTKQTVLTFQAKHFGQCVIVLHTFCLSYSVVCKQIELAVSINFHPLLLRYGSNSKAGRPLDQASDGRKRVSVLEARWLL